tara:strand:+ start:117046 stop:117837 length:792 start_codon:yes stop_codon:yes gene_type:complete
MPIRFKGPVRPRKLKSPDPIKMPVVRNDKVPRIKSEVLYYKEHGSLPTEPAVVYDISSNNETGSFDPSGAFYLTDELRSAEKTYGSTYVSVQHGDDWAFTQLTKVSDNQIKTFPILPGHDFTLTLECNRAAYGANISAFVALDDQNYQGTSCAPLFYWWWQTNNDGRLWNQITPFGTYYASNTIGVLDAEFDPTSGGGWNFDYPQTFKITKTGNVVTVFVNAVQVGTTLWTYDSTFAPTLRLGANNSTTRVGNFRLTVTDPNA